MPRSELHGLAADAFVWPARCVAEGLGVVQDWKLVVTGHSLAAGAAALLTLQLKDRYPGDPPPAACPRQPPACDCCQRGIPMRLAACTCQSVVRARDLLQCQRSILAVHG